MTAQSPVARLWTKDAPIIRSALETDVYKILMLFYIWTYYPWLQVKWGFKNRKVDVPLAQYVPLAALREQLQHVRDLRFSEADIAYLTSWQMFDPKFLKELQELRLPMPIVKEVEGQLSIEVEGSWMETTLWEIYILAIVAELYFRGRATAEGITEQALFDEGMERLIGKIEFLNRHPELKVALFGLRRRGSGPWEDLVTELMLVRTSGSIVGVSNVYLAQKYSVEAVGTNAHELQMAEYGVSRHMGETALEQAPYTVLRRWEDLYAHKARIMLSDTFGTESFLRNLPPDITRSWVGHRQDSGDPFVIGDMIIADYERRGIDPTEKRILFTDGLNPQKMLQIYEHFCGRVQIGFGVGTNFSNDFGLVTPLSIVMKLIEAAGNPTVKLSDNLEKAMGPADEVALAKAVFGYTNQFREQTTY